MSKKAEQRIKPANLMVRVPLELVHQIDEFRGDVPRETYIRGMLINRLDQLKVGQAAARTRGSNKYPATKKRTR